MTGLLARLRPGLTQAGILAAAVGGISLSAPLIVGTAAPALVIAFWRTAGAAALLAPVALMAALRRRCRARITPRDRWRCALAGVFLAGHFGTWIPSLGLTTVAASTALVCTQPLWSAVLTRVCGARVPGAVWAGVVLALIGVVLLGGRDLGAPGALGGDLLAASGGILGAAHVVLGERVRRSVDTARYNLAVFTAAAVALGLVAAASATPLTGYSLRAWLVIAAVTVSGQLIGHGLLNRVLTTLGATTVSIVALLEVPTATALAALFLGQYPSRSVLLSALLIAIGMAMVLRCRE